MEQLTGWRGVAIPWLKQRWPRRFTHTRFAASLLLMRHARFCLTDTYHFVLNSLSQGSLALCVVRDEPPTASTLNELVEERQSGQLAPPRTIVGVSLLVQAPTGQYDPDRLINIGTNRWTFRPEVGVSVPVHFCHSTLPVEAVSTASEHE